MILRWRNIVCLFFVFICLFVGWLIGCLFYGGGRESAKTESKNPHFQNEAKCTTFLVKMSFICMRTKYHFHIKSWALNLVLIQRPEGTRKWPVSMWVQFFFACESQGPVAWKFRLKSWCFYIQDRGFKTDFADNTNYGTDREKGAPVPKLFNALTAGCISPLMPFPIPNIIFL